MGCVGWVWLVGISFHLLQLSIRSDICSVQLRKYAVSGFGRVGGFGQVWVQLRLRISLRLINKQTDLVLEMTPPEALEPDKNQNQKPKKSGPISTNLSFFELCLRQAELKQVSSLKQTNYTNITVHFLFFFSFSFDTEGDTSNPICRVF